MILLFFGAFWPSALFPFGGGWGGEESRFQVLFVTRAFPGTLTISEKKYIHTQRITAAYVQEKATKSALSI